MIERICDNCVHFKKFVLMYKGEPIRPGQILPREFTYWTYHEPDRCTLNPKWEDVSQRHYCGQFKEKSSDSPNIKGFRRPYE